MALKIKEDISNSIVYKTIPVNIGIPHQPNGLPIGSPVYSYMNLQPISIPKAPALDMPEASLPRALNYYADYGGCGFWRMIWPEFLLNGYQKACISGLTCMVLDPRFYRDIKAIRVQRQATPAQRDFIKELRKLSHELKFRMIYEVDDIVFKDDIPDYNRCKEPFCDKAITESIVDIMKNMDEITVTCNFMKEYYKDKIGTDRVTVIPNYAPKFWLDRFYDIDKIKNNFEKNKKRPRILYAGSGTHIDVMNKTNGKDDFGHVLESIIKARKKFKFVFKGCYPIALKPFIDSGEMEFIQWSQLFDLPRGLYEANCNAVYAPLADNTFNKSKSNIKMIESGALGIPGVFQDLCTYETADLKFKSGDDLINQLEYLTSDFDKYIKLSEKSRKYVEGMWLEDHIDEYEAIYFTEWGSKERKEKAPNLINLNPEQNKS
jgi:hypothetical protein